MRAKVVALAAAIGFAGILALNFALIRQNRHLKAELAAPPALLPKIGTRIDQLAGVALDGSQARVLFDGQARRTLLFVFSTRCAVCNLNWPQWQAITRSVPSQNFRLVYANIQSPITQDYERQYGIEHATVFAELDPRYESGLNLRLTPLTILLTPNGTVTRVWPGLLSQQEFREVLSSAGPKSR